MTNLIIFERETTLLNLDFLYSNLIIFLDIFCCCHKKDIRISIKVKIYIAIIIK